MLIHSIISWYVQMMSINGFGVVILPMCVMLGQICGGGLSRISLDLHAYLLRLIPTRWYPQLPSIPCSSTPSSLDMFRWCYN
jgi:hypothetical protein